MTSTTNTQRKPIEKDIHLSVVKGKKSPITKQGLSLFAKELVIFGIVIAIAAFVMIFSMAKLDEVNRDIARIDVKIAEAEAQGVALQSALDTNLSLKEIEEWAQENGMIKIQDHQVSYVDLSDGDKIVMVNGEDVSSRELEE